MPNFNFFNAFGEDVAEGVHNLSSDTIKVMLTNTAPTASDSQKADLTEISGGNGYSAGGETLSNVSSTRSGGTYTFNADDLVITASGGSIGPFQYAVLYNDTATSDELIGWVDHGSAVTLADTETFTLDFDGTNGIFTIS